MKICKGLLSSRSQKRPNSAWYEEAKNVKKFGKMMTTMWEEQPSE
jgi:hypothetical protein